MSPDTRCSFTGTSLGAIGTYRLDLVIQRIRSRTPADTEPVDNQVHKGGPLEDLGTQMGNCILAAPGVVLRRTKASTHRRTPPRWHFQLCLGGLVRPSCRGFGTGFRSNPQVLNPPLRKALVQPSWTFIA